MITHRAVLDTNVVVSGKQSKNPRSPNAEILSRWIASEFVLLYSEGILEEYTEKLLFLGAPEAEVSRFIFDIISLAEHVPVRFFHLRHYPEDPDVTPFLLAALNGGATHLVTYDEHLQQVSAFYPEFKTCEPLGFLQDLRAATP